MDEAHDTCVKTVDYSIECCRGSAKIHEEDQTAKGMAAALTVDALRETTVQTA